MAARDADPVYNHFPLTPPATPTFSSKPSGGWISEEDERRGTFTDWRFESVQSVESLVQAGFSWTGVEDLVRCKSCQSQLRNWRLEDNPIYRHELKNENCPFLKDLARKRRPKDEWTESDHAGLKSSIISDDPLTEQQEDIFIDNFTCKICYTKMCGAAFQPCGCHSLCTDCQSGTLPAYCPSCNTPVTHSVEVLLV